MTSGSNMSFPPTMAHPRRCLYERKHKNRETEEIESFNEEDRCTR
jgi:hypothetical protein